MIERDEVLMPQLGESIVEGTIVRFTVQVGDQVSRGQMLAEVETDKATTEIPAPRSGIVAALLCSEGDTLEVGGAILRLAPTADVQAPQSSAGSGLSGSAQAAAARPPGPRLAPQPVGGPPRTSPTVRRLAREHDVDLNALTGSGRRGRLTRDDIMARIEGDARPTPSTPPPVADQTPFPSLIPRPAPIASALPRKNVAYRPKTYQPRPTDTVVPFNRRRQMIAEHMRYSLETSAHVATIAEVDMSRVVAAKKADAGAAAARGIRLTYLPYIVSAVAQSLIEHPELNATVVDESLVMRGHRNIGIAVDTTDGLIVPVIKNADELTVLGLARAIQDLSERAQQGKLTGDDLAGGSFTISNPGRRGNLFGISIIRQPEVGILRIGAITKVPVVREIEGEDAIVIRPMMYMALSYDHRVIDGRSGNHFLYEVSERLAKTKPNTAI